MKSLRIAAIIAAAFLIGTAGSVSADTSRFVRADVIADSVTYIGYSANIQVRATGTDLPQLAVWVGGYLTDGTFVQNGLQTYNIPGIVPVFVWATRDGDPTHGPVPVEEHDESIAPGTWVTFQLVQYGSVWTFRWSLTGSGVWHNQASFTDAARLMSVSFTTEYHGDVQPFANQAMHSVKVKGAYPSGWLDPRLGYGPPAEQCGHEDMTRSGSNLEFLSGTFNCVTYKELLP